MNRVIQNFLEVLTSRITALIGSAIGSTAATFRVTHHAKQLAHLEELAQKYDDEGKPFVAEMLRQRASRMELDDPGSDARAVMDNLLDRSQSDSLLLHEQSQSPSGSASLPKPQRRRRKRESSTDKDDVS